MTAPRNSQAINKTLARWVWLNVYILCSFCARPVSFTFPEFLLTTGTMWTSELKNHLFWLWDVLSLQILSPGQQSRNYPTKHFAILAWVQEVIIVSFLHIQMVLLSISPLEETPAQIISFQSTDGTDKSPINMCTDKFLSVGMDPRKYSPVDVITLSKPLITLPSV